MIQQIRDLMKIKEEIDTTNKNISENSKIVSDLKNELESLKKEFAEAKLLQQEFLKSFRDNISAIESMRKDLGSEIFEFKLLKSQMQRKILEKFEEELHKNLESNKETLKKDIDDYNELRKKFNEILSTINLTNNGLNKFIEIGKNIKREDFELTKFAKQFLEMDNEKLRLMRKIDNLEHLISRMRRKEFVR